MTTDFEILFKTHLRALAKEKNRDNADIWQSIALERFLVRLSRSSYRDRFILKGGMLLSKYIEIGRETVDLDLLGQRVGGDANQLVRTIETVASMDLGDGFLFKEIKASPLPHPHMGYPCIDIFMQAHFGDMKTKVALDIGFGDTVPPTLLEIPLLCRLFEESVSLSCYPIEFIFAEKLEIIIHRGSLNSRIKDFHDLYSILSLSRTSHQKIEEAIEAVFRHRKTKLSLPIVFSRKEMEQFERQWRDYIKPLRKQSLPGSFTSLLEKVNDWLQVKPLSR